MEFDPYLNKLFLFRYPSFCLANIPSDDPGQSENSTIYACATSRDITGGQWATKADVAHMLQEIILSYRLLFGQSKASRQLFQTLTPFENIPENGKDTFLEQLCCRKQYQSNPNGPKQERETYDLSHDFPILRSRLLPLLRHLASKKPRTWKQLWEDKRDSASWLTFWAVIIIGYSALMPRGLGRALHPPLCPALDDAFVGRIILSDAYLISMEESVRLDKHPFRLLIRKNYIPPFELYNDICEVSTAYFEGLVCHEYGSWNDPPERLDFSQLSHT
ncbi:hypothetical protein V499_07195 [Pseudogymnoascus sp. VKM F-103]|nr:hypothetical protein V499_07195 [Pseudogymnoascus sp. VKM F-103]